ncbi:hypothetical protein FOMPIDRAFT_116539 [Fomitopsis schrenkii]|uniref:F-box domain-containing protein n=1 Tax=Fomitopsis schrenkii TaxID=2126942 RepID=S8E000_FOMSC|nr:hypothetical protein FOMPIDRAFT_116539 [Fomitopsis schrenkii]
MPMDSYETTATSPILPAAPGSSPGRIPLDVCERVIDHVAMALLDRYWYYRDSDPMLWTLHACALVCRDWYHLSWYYLRRHILLGDREAVLWLRKTLNERPRLRNSVRQLTVAGNGVLDEARGPITHLGAVAAMLVGKVPNVTELAIVNATWTVGATRVDDFIYFAAFRSVTILTLLDVTLSRTSQLALLVSALPLLDTLSYSQSIQPSGVGRSQKMLDACVESLETAKIHIHPGLPFASHAKGVVVYLSSEGDDIEGLVRQLDDSPVLIQLDDILQEERFARIETFEVYMVASSQAPNEHFLGEEEVWGQWAELMRRKMPMSDKRGILRYAVRTILRHVYLTQQQCSYFNRVEIGVSAPP